VLAAAAEERIQGVSQARGGRRAVGMDVERVEEREDEEARTSSSQFGWRRHSYWLALDLTLALGAREERQIHD
jgi:hypothetical protein